MSSSDVEDLHKAHAFSPHEVAELRAAWLEWYDRGHREMPWRNEASASERAALGRVERAQWAYRVWVSEVMLQQTQVDRVVPYFLKWMEKFPTIDALAGASIDEVRSVWTGLGYYRRAAFLLEGAQQIARAGDGLPPETAAGWGAIKGVGPYTAGAIASIVYNEATPLVDGNVIRVLARLRAVGANPKLPGSVKLWWRLAAELVHSERPGDLNQAMMELGATLCSKTAPSCSRCPLSAHCRAYTQAVAALGGARADGWERQVSQAVQQYPAAAPKAAKRQLDLAVCVLQRVPAELAAEWRGAGTERARAVLESRLWEAGELLLLKRPEEAAGARNKKLLAGLWELPTALLSASAEGEAGEEDGEADEPPDGADGGAADDAHRQAALDAVLRAHGLACCAAEHTLCRQLVSVGAAGEARPVVHTFSHLRHSMLVEWMVVSREAFASQGEGEGDGNAATTCWLREAEVASKGASSAVAKLVECARAHAMRTAIASSKPTGKPTVGGGARGKRKAVAEPVPPSRSIASFFGKPCGSAKPEAGKGLGLGPE